MWSSEVEYSLSFPDRRLRAINSRTDRKLHLTSFSREETSSYVERHLAIFSLSRLDFEKLMEYLDTSRNFR